MKLLVKMAIILGGGLGGMAALSLAGQPAWVVVLPGVAGVAASLSGVVRNLVSGRPSRGNGV